ncbi:MAG: DUF58 domain-containing protein [Deltaproteobacteria bacterium]|jgi:uncharacterized protein (DUF58 family)|nr:DUF58 domain-containing protein [Deltaproteobacteria bacterium]
MNRPQIRPTLKTAALFAGSIPLTVLIGTNDLSHWYLALLAPFAFFIFLGVDLAKALTDADLTVDLTAPSLIYVGVGAKATLVIKANWPRETLLDVLLEADGPLTPPIPIKITLKDGEVTANIPILGNKRGQIDLKALWLKWRGPTGLVSIQSIRPVSLKVSVAQNVYRLNEDVISFLSQKSFFGSKSQPFRGEGTEFECLTDFATGMDPRHIDWKRSGRHHKLLAREFRQERNHLIVFGFDTGRLTLEPVGPATKLDHFVAAALRLARVSLKSGDLVGGCGYDLTFHSFLKPSRGPNFFARFLAFTASLNYRFEETNHTLALAELMNRLPHRSLIVLFTDFIDDVSAELLLESLTLLTRRHMAIFVTMGEPFLNDYRQRRPNGLFQVAEAVFADNFVKNREIVLNRVRRLGALCLDAKVGQIAPDLINKYLLIKSRGLL